MTAVEFDRLSDDTGPAHAHGWIVSTLCHLLGVGCAVLLMAEIEKPVLPNMFQWEVAVVESPAPVEPAPRETPPAEPVVQPSRPLLKPITPVQHAVQDIATPVEATPVQTVQAVQQATQDVVTQAEPVLDRPALQSTESRTVLAKAVSSNQESVVEQLAAQPTLSSAVERVEPIQARAAVIEQDAPSVESMLSAIEHRIIQKREVRFLQAQADYGWLSDALRGRIEELKRYPAQARVNHWEGKVVIQAVIRHDGTVIGLQIAESSGRPVLDQEALEVMKKLSPLTLKHPLGKSEVTILVPISYRLDG